MYKQFWRCTVLLCLMALAATAQVRMLSFYEVRPTTQAPVLDGRLDDSAWKNIPVHDTYYEYAKPEPGPGKLKTRFMMTYDARGLYMAVVNVDHAMDKIRQHIHNYDDSRLWTDDSGEFYFDPDATSIGFSKFTINALGVRADMRKLDMAVTLNDWNGAGWQAQATQNPTDWTIEAFFPWEDLNHKPVPGDLWMFVHTRYNWTDGFVGVGSSPGGGYQAPDKFGYLYFTASGATLDSNQVAAVLTPRAHAPWILGLGDDLLSNLGGRTQISPLQWEVRQARQHYHLALLAVQLIGADASADELAAITAKVKEYQGNGLADYQGLQNLNQQLFDLKWNLLLEKKIQVKQCRRAMVRSFRFLHHNP